MKLTMIGVALATCLLGCASGAAAADFAFEVNGVEANDLTGVELGAGVNFQSGRFSLSPTVGVLVYQGDNDRYSLETFNNGATVCRDHSNGQFADKENCDNAAVQAYGKIQAGVWVTKKVKLGAGVRFSEDDTNAYGRIAVLLSERMAVQGFGGKDYYGAGLTFGF